MVNGGNIVVVGPSHLRAIAKQYSPNPFDKLPMEMNQRIATFLQHDADIAAFRVSCRSALDAVEGHNASFWRDRFLQTFDPPATPMSNQEMKKVYKLRKVALTVGVNFTKADDRREHKKINACLKHIRDLIIDSFSGMPANRPDLIHESPNMAILETFSKSHGLFGPMFQNTSLTGRAKDRHHDPQKGDSLLFTIRNMLLPLMLEKENITNVCSYPDTQQSVYASAKDQPIFIGAHHCNVDMVWLQHQVNFWKYHVTRKEEATLFGPYYDLASDERPQMWQAPLCQEDQNPTLGKHWKGSYAFVDRPDIALVRGGQGGDEQILDEFNMEDSAGAFQDMTLGMSNKSESDWDPIFEKILGSLKRKPSKRQTRAQRSSLDPDTVTDVPPLSFRFDGVGHDNEEDFHADGWLNALPPQQGIPGWRRMTMMKYYYDEFGVMDVQALWAYEGVVLPGGRVILGRWWCPSDGTGDAMYSGPFILWCVDRPGMADDNVEIGERK